MLECVWYQGYLPSTGFSDVNLPGITQIRIHFNLGSNNNAYSDVFHAGDATGIGNRPLLNCGYTLLIDPQRRSLRSADLSV